MRKTPLNPITQPEYLLLESGVTRRLTDISNFNAKKIVSNKQHTLEISQNGKYGALHRRTRMARFCMENLMQHPILAILILGNITTAMSRLSNRAMFIDIQSNNLMYLLLNIYCNHPTKRKKTSSFCCPTTLLPCDTDLTY